MSKRLDLKGVCSFLKANNDYLILTHAMPDGDTLGSAYALCKGLIALGKNAKVACPDVIPERYGYFTKAVSFPEFSEKTVISVDVADIKLMGALGEKYKDRIVLAIDHHASHRDFAENLFLDGTAAACAECIYDILAELHIMLDETMVEAIYTGISTDTGCFKFSNTTPKTHVIAAELMAYGIDFADINRVMFDTKSKSRMEIEKRALRKVEMLYRDRVAIMAVTEEMMKDSGCTDSDLDGITAIPRSIEGVLIGVTLRQKAKKLWKISMRSYPPYDVAAICGELGGGGHKYAAGCELSGSLKSAKKQILKQVSKVLED